MRRQFTNPNLEESYVQSADGSLYSISCLQQNAAQIQSQGTMALNQCNAGVSSANTGQVTRGRAALGAVGCYGSNCQSNSSWIYYPPTYYPSTLYNQSYPSTYNPFNDNRYRNDYFCGFVFGGAYNFNCYYLFGYQSPNYQSYYNPYCSSSCLYSVNYSSCVAQSCLTPFAFY
jgi:hypothetical protein